MVNVQLTDQAAIITAAASGLAAATAERLAEAGANLVLGDINEEGVKKKAAELAEKYDIKAFGLKCDTSDKEEFRQLFELAKKEFGKIDIVVNVAGISNHQPLEEADEDAVRKMVEINIFGIDYAYKLAWDYMKDQGHGRVVGISSVAGRGGSTLEPHYAMTKAAVINLTQSYAILGAKAGITYNSICPGIIRTNIWNEWLNSHFDTPEKRDAVFQSFVDKIIPLKRAQEPIDIANAILFFVSDLSRNITGQALNVCGGMHMD